MDDFEGSLKGVDLLHVIELRTNTTVEADNLILDKSGQWQILEQLVDPHENGIVIVGILAKTCCTLLRETETIIDPSILMVTTNQVDLLGVPHFQGQEKTNCL